MKTFLMLWNPAISSYTIEGCEEDFEYKYQETDFWDNPSYFPYDFNWSICDWKEARIGDRFYMVRVGKEGPNGIVMAGTIASEPYLGEDWSGKGREVHYVDMDIEVAVHPDSDKILSSDILEKLLPEIGWRGGQSGQLIDKESVNLLDKIWREHIFKYLSMENKALEIARKAHKGQLDKAGKDYINHPIKVASALEGEAKIVALLHDVVEDTDITLEQIRNYGFNEIVIDALDAVTKREGENYDEFISRIKDNPVAVKVKLADLKDNMDLLRLPELSERDLQRIAKYHKAYRFLEKYDTPSEDNAVLY